VKVSELFEEEPESLKVMAAKKELKTRFEKLMGKAIDEILKYGATFYSPNRVYYWVEAPMFERENAFYGANREQIRKAPWQGTCHCRGG
jgi:vacuolar-type H+-ATPase subunit E/Vma4